MKKGIGYSPLSGKVYLGKQDEKKGMWIGEKEDITSDFIHVLFQFCEPDTARVITTVNGLEENIIINVKKDAKSIKKVISYLKKQLK